VYAHLTDLLTRNKDPVVKLRALGALSQLPYYSQHTKKIMANTPHLLERLIRIMQTDDPWSHDVQQAQMRACRVVAAICSTPASNPDVCRTVVEYPVCTVFQMYVCMCAYIHTYMHTYIRVYVHTTCTWPNRRSCTCGQQRALSFIRTHTHSYIRHVHRA
jgi:hypothetical protein